MDNDPAVPVVPAGTCVVYHAAAGARATPGTEPGLPSGWPSTEPPPSTAVQRPLLRGHVLTDCADSVARMPTQHPEFRFTCPGALIAALPAVLGFVPEKSLVLVALEEGRMGRSCGLT